MADEIKAGDIVKLKSGGPNMTVTEVKDDQAELFWFEELHGTYEAGEASLPLAALSLVTVGLV